MLVNSWLSGTIYIQGIQQKPLSKATYNHSHTHSRAEGVVDHAWRQPARQEHRGLGVLLRDTSTLVWRRSRGYKHWCSHSNIHTPTAELTMHGDSQLVRSSEAEVQCSGRHQHSARRHIHSVVNHARRQPARWE